MILIFIKNCQQCFFLNPQKTSSYKPYFIADKLGAKKVAGFSEMYADRLMYATIKVCTQSCVLMLLFNRNLFDLCIYSSYCILRRDLISGGTGGHVPPNFLNGGGGHNINCVPPTCDRYSLAYH